MEHLTTLLAGIYLFLQANPGKWFSYRQLLKEVKSGRGGQDYDECINVLVDDLRLVSRRLRTASRPTRVKFRR